MVISADSMGRLQYLLDKLAESSQWYILDINLDKTKVIIKNNNQVGKFIINQKWVERVNKYSYLETTANEW